MPPTQHPSAAERPPQRPSDTKLCEPWSGSPHTGGRSPTMPRPPRPQAAFTPDGRTTPHHQGGSGGCGHRSLPGSPHAAGTVPRARGPRRGSPAAPAPAASPRRPRRDRSPPWPGPSRTAQGQPRPALLAEGRPHSPARVRGAPRKPVSSPAGSAEMSDTGAVTHAATEPGTW